MEFVKFYDSEEACRYAAGLTEKWRCENDDIIGLQDVIECLQECPLDDQYFNG